MALKISYPEPGDDVPQWAKEDTLLTIKDILEKKSIKWNITIVRRGISG
mgnify:CR=1 FL=1